VIAPAHALTLLADKLEPGERVLYAVRPDIWVTLRNKLFLLWIGIPWCAGTLSLYFAGRAAPMVALPLAMVGIAMVAAPIIMAIDTRSTIYAITDRRVLIVRDGLRPDFLECPFERTDEAFEVLAPGGKGGHLYFASGMSTKLRDVDYTGKLAFRDLADPQEAARQLDAARKGHSEPL
jgi:hypothetical protein